MGEVSLKSEMLGELSDLVLNKIKNEEIKTKLSKFSKN